MRTLSFLLVLALVIGSCQNQGTQTEDTPAEDTADTTAYTLTPFEASEAYPAAELQSMEFQDGQFNFSVSNYELGVQTPDADQKMCANSDQGQHIHLIVDRQPYAAKYVSSFEYEIADGEHYLLAFLSRSYHESIKNGTAHIAQKVTVEDNSITASEDISEHMLFYSRPKGTYVGKAQTEKVMLDFFLHNIDLTEGHKVKAEINGETHMIDTWQPY
ncbi:MAG: hypothetical protein R3350_03875 [Saprospiraceae bacterium]|nr:hypothetical protein [Saprospiraceae bacterium]